MPAAVSPRQAIVLGMCRTCGADLRGGEPHDARCEEDAFVEADAEWIKLDARASDAFDDYAFVRSRSRGKAVAIAWAKFERCDAELKARTEDLRARYRAQHRRTCSACLRPYSDYCAACAWLADEAAP
jgi:hypothetical protein